MSVAQELGEEREKLGVEPPEAPVVTQIEVRLLRDAVVKLRIHQDRRRNEGEVGGEEQAQEPSLDGEAVAPLLQAVHERTPVGTVAAKPVGPRRVVCDGEEMGVLFECLQWTDGRAFFLDHGTSV